MQIDTYVIDFLEIIDTPIDIKILKHSLDKMLKGLNTNHGFTKKLSWALSSRTLPF